MVKVRGSGSEMMVTGSDDPVTQCATLKAWSTLYITLQIVKKQTCLDPKKVRDIAQNQKKFLYIEPKITIMPRWALQSVQWAPSSVL